MARYDRPPPRRKRDRDALARRRFLVLHDIGAGALIADQRQYGHTLKSAARVLSALYGLDIRPTTAREWLLRWVELQQRLGIRPERVPPRGKIRRAHAGAARRNQAESELDATRRALARKATRAGVAAQDVPVVVAALMRGDPILGIESNGAQAVAAERLGKALEAQASVQALAPPLTDIVVSEVELRRLGRSWRERAHSLRSA